EPASVQRQDPVAARAQAIFKASEEAKPFDPADFDFAIDDEMFFEAPPPATSPDVSAAVEPAPAPRSAPKPKKNMGMTPLQLAVLIGLALALVCIVAGFVYYILALA
ncbi:MAG: hypothetical protein ACM3PS_08980, partial [Syntrophothermus sp.]